MNIYAISDLHLSLDADGGEYKPMSRFGAAWERHWQRVEENWREIVSEEDMVLLPGDLSWAMTLAEAEADLAFLGRLPGRKLLIKGNHDYWWQSVSQVQAALPASARAVQHTAIAVGSWAITGTRGWLIPEHSEFKESEDRKLYQRELLRLEMGLAEAVKVSREIMVLLHYPPLLDGEKESGFSQLLAAFGVKHCLYGHIHGDKSAAFEGEKDGVAYHNCSCDRLEMRPIWVASAG